MVQALDKPVEGTPGVRDAEVPVGADPEGADPALALAAQGAWALVGLDGGRAFVGAVRDALAYLGAVRPAWTDVAPGGLGGTPFAPDVIQVDPDAGRGVLDASQEEALDAALKEPDEDLDVGLVLDEDLKRRGI